MMSGRRTNLAAARKSAGHTQESLAAALHIDRSTVIRWEAGDYTPLPYLRPKLARLLRQTPEQLHALFNIAGTTPPAEPLSKDIAHACAWLDQRLDWPSGASARSVADRLPSVRRDLPARRARRARVTQQQIARALRAYYGDDPVYSTYTDGDITTSILTRADWLDLQTPLTSEHEHSTVETSTGERGTVEIDPAAALDRLAEVEAAGVRLTNDSLYRILDIDVRDDGLHTRLGVAEFLEYALTLDLLENELLDAIADGRRTEPGTLPLRDSYLPDLASVTGLSDRLCVGGIVVLTAIARPGNDYAVLLQDRSAAVVNAPNQRTVIPKGFHQPITDTTADAPFRVSLLRELEEELFGRTDLDGTLGPSLALAPLHEGRLSAPMRWLHHHDALRLEITALGINLVSGNLECACLATIDNPDFWTTFAGDIEANWEAQGLEAHAALTVSRPIGPGPASTPWNNEGLFAYVQGLNRGT